VEGEEEGIHVPPAEEPEESERETWDSTIDEEERAEKQGNGST